MVASPESEFAYLLAKKMLKAAIPERQRVRLLDLHRVLGNRADKIARRLFGNQLGQRLIGWIKDRGWNELEANIPTLRRALRRRSILRHPGNFAAHVPAEMARLLGRVM